MVSDDPPTLTEIKDEKGILKYSIQQRLGEGGYGRVYAGTDTNNNKVAVKFEPKNKCTYGTPYEWEVYSALEKDGKTKLNEILYKCSSKEDYIMVMDMLESINVDKKPSLEEVYRFAREAIKIFQNLHQAGYIHGDVKLGNFLSKPHSENSTTFFDDLFLVDFGLASRWKDNSTGRHVEYSQHPTKFRGTLTYASVHALLGRTASRRDDMISLLYTLIELLEENKDKYFRRNKDKLGSCNDKMKMNLGFLPTKLKEFAKNVTELKFDEEPNYDKWIREFQSNHNDSPYVTSNPCKKVGKTRWITVVNTRYPMKQRYHFEIQNEKMLHCIFNKGIQEKLYISSAVFYNDTWALIMDENKSFTEQELGYEAINSEDSKSSIKNGNFYITALIKKANSTADGQIDGNVNDITEVKADDNADGKADDKAGDKATNKDDGKSDDKIDDTKWQIVKSKGTTYTHQVCQIVDSYTDLYQKIYQLWKLGHFVTSLTATGKKWAFVMSRDAEFSAQVIEYDVCFPAEGILRRWKQGYMVTAMAASTTDNLTEMAVVMSVLKTNKAVNELQEIFISDGEEFPSKKLKECWFKRKYVTSFCYATVSFGEEEYPKHLSSKE
ncbi:hypothetical protein ZOSMA_317G00210 [Zostera marina]|uniref:Protein kinase domain-containing protein n=1 Tax=Zostera marina TaxID=29655 RepID=A0A0K9PBQ4_ZOSMR|nr:hypothetical protein ZOSMA_317G00210 [Zostera marina]